MCYRSVPTVPNALIVDSFEPHRSIQKCLSQKNCILHVIPNGCSSKFQPLNVGITHLFQVKLINLLYLFKKAPLLVKTINNNIFYFKASIKNQWDKFPTSENKVCLSNQRYRCPDHETILEWVQNAFEEIQEDPLRIKNAFKTTGLLQ